MGLAPPITSAEGENRPHPKDTCMDSGRTDSVEGGSAKGRSVAGLRSTACSIGGGGSTPTADSVAAGMMSVDATGGCPVATETVSTATMAG